VTYKRTEAEKKKRIIRAEVTTGIGSLPSSLLVLRSWHSANPPGAQRVAFVSVSISNFTHSPFNGT
jgi:hypothetical protein